MSTCLLGWRCLDYEQTGEKNGGNAEEHQWSEENEDWQREVDERKMKNKGEKRDLEAYWGKDDEGTQISHWNKSEPWRGIGRHAEATHARLRRPL